MAEVQNLSTFDKKLGLYSEFTVANCIDGFVMQVQTRYECDYGEITHMSVSSIHGNVVDLVPPGLKSSVKKDILGLISFFESKAISCERIRDIATVTVNMFDVYDMYVITEVDTGNYENKIYLLNESRTHAIVFTHTPERVCGNMIANNIHDVHSPGSGIQTRH